MAPRPPIRYRHPHPATAPQVARRRDRALRRETTQPEPHPIQPHAHPTTLAEIAPLRDAYRSSATYQIVRDSILPRGLATPWLLSLGDEPIGYAGVWLKHYPGRILELVLHPEAHAHARRLVEALSAAANATEIEYQSNAGDSEAILRPLCNEWSTEKLLFADGPDAGPTRDDLLLRPRRDETEWPHGDWVALQGERVLGGGGFLTHYNPPFADIYMEVVPEARGEGVGRFLVGELRRVCREAGYVPAARCDPDNVGSARALLGGGMVECGRIDVGTLAL